MNALTSRPRRAAGCAAVAAALPAASSAAPPAPRRGRSRPRLVRRSRRCSGTGSCSDLQATPGAQPATVHPTYDLAIMHTAIYDAVVVDRPRGAPYLPRVPARASASAAAAVDAAAHDTLVRSTPRLRPSIDAAVRDAAGAVPRGARQDPGHPRRPARRGADPRAPRRTTARPRRPSRFEPGTAPRRLPAHAARVRAARVHPLVAGQAVRPAPRRRVPAARPAAADERRSTPPRSNEVKALGAADRLDPHGRPDADRPVLEPADLGDLEPDRPDGRARPPRDALPAARARSRR